MYDVIGRIAFVGIPAVAVFYVLVVGLVWQSDQRGEGLEGILRAILRAALGAAAWVGGSLWARPRAMFEDGRFTREEEA